MSRPFVEALAGLVALAVLLALPVVWPSHALIDFVIRLAAYGLFATSLNLLVGYGGMVSFGHGMFVGLGAYAFGLLMERTALPLPVAVPLAIVFAGIIAVPVGALAVRLRAIYFAFVTLAMQMLLYNIITSWISLTGGDQGLRGGIQRRAFAGIDLADQRQLYVVSLVLLLAGLLAMRHVLAAPFGYALRMVRDNEARAAFLGVDVFRVRLTAFVIAALFAALGGVLMSLYVSGAYPELAYWTVSGQGIFMIMLGGIASFLGAILLQLGDVMTRFTEYNGLALGVVILVVALGLRRGLLDYAQLRLGRT
jgi:branched-chain amino acid transport system permease protein